MPCLYSFLNHQSSSLINIHSMVVIAAKWIVSILFIKKLPKYWQVFSIQMQVYRLSDRCKDGRPYQSWHRFTSAEGIGIDFHFLTCIENDLKPGLLHSPHSVVPGWLICSSLLHRQLSISSLALSEDYLLSPHLYPIEKLKAHIWLLLQHILFSKVAMTGFDSKIHTQDTACRDLGISAIWFKCLQ